MRYQYDLGLSQEEKEKLDETEYRNLGTEESQIYCGCRKRMKKNRTSWSDDSAETMVKVISYIKSNLLDEIIIKRMEKAIQEELSKRMEEPKKVFRRKFYANLTQEDINIEIIQIKIQIRFDKSLMIRKNIEKVKF